MAPNYHDYTVHFDQLLGKGGFCAVYQATGPDGKVVAMKVPHLAAGDDTWNPENNRRFQHEAKVWSSLCKRTIPGVVQVYGYGIKPHPWLAMELMEGRTLREKIKKGLSIAESLAIIKPVIRCLSEVHLLGVIHRDIKPENILFTKGGVPKVADWGLGKVLLEPSLSSDGIKGTLKYLAPEQFRIEEQDMLDRRTDIYQLGAVLYEMMTGKPPFPTDNVPVLVNCILNKKLVPPLRQNPKIPKHVNGVILKCLEKTKENRFRSMDIVLDRLKGSETRDEPHPSKGDLLAELDNYFNHLRIMGVATSEEERQVKAMRKYARLKWHGRVEQEAPILLKELKERYQRERKALMKRVETLFEECISCGLDIEELYNLNDEALKAHETRDFEKAENLFHSLEMKQETLLKPLYHGETTPQNAIQKQQAWARKLGVDVAFTTPSGIEFVLIPAGTFTMGLKEQTSATPHQVTLSKPFYLGKYPVTQAQWKEIMGKNPSHFKGDTRPVENVSWSDCQEFIQKINARERGNTYHLPTEAEWEYACRAGTTTRFCFGDDEARLGEYAWFDGNSGSETHPFGQKKANAWSLYDMHGNVWEWCQDWYGEYTKRAVTDPSGSGSGSGRVVRGGCWIGNAKYCASASRINYDPGTRYSSLGFRLARSL